MKLIVKISLLLVIFQSYNSNILAQKKLFRTESQDFFSDFYDYTKSSGKKGEKVYKTLKTEWDSLYNSDDDKKLIVQSLNLIIKKNGKLIPHMDNYLNCIYSFNRQQHDIISYREWAKASEKMLSKYSISQMNNYFISTSELLSNNILYLKYNKTWYHTGTFTFEYKARKLNAVFKKGNLVGKLKEDSTVVYDTQGNYILINNSWNGKGGKITWEKNGFNPNDRYAELSTYTLKLNNSNIKAEKVNLTDNVYRLASIDGKIEDKITPLNKPLSNSFPKFKSYSENLKLSNIHGFINFKGGFSTRGRKAYIYVDKNPRADMWLTQNKEIIGHLRAKSFVLDSTTVSSLLSSIEINVDTSSVFHPGINFKMLIKDENKNELSMFRKNEGIYASPFYDNYHKMDIYADIAVWYPDKNEIKFQNNITSSKGYVYFRSSNFFDPNDLLLKGRYPKHPVRILNDFSADEFEAHELARYMRLPTQQIVYMLLDLSYKGIIEFDLETRHAKLLPRYYAYLEALRGKADYDNLEMASKPSKYNRTGATYNLKNGNLVINNILPIPVSLKQQVTVTPANDSIVLKKGRNFDFDGEFNIGNFKFVGKNFSFLYDDYKINLDSVEYLEINVPTVNRDSTRKALTRVLNVIENITGDVLIDNPSNKSGLEDFPEYPILSSYDTSYVFYDKVVKPNGVYPRDKFFFQIYPYQIDSLSSFTTDKIQLLGEFHSDSIFPVFKDVNLVIQPDYSLGFNKPTSETGDSLYGDKGLFFNDLVLNSKGLGAVGAIEYLGTKTYSSAFIFFPDSMTTRASKFEIKKQTDGYQFPDVSSDSIYIQWYPQSDSMWVNNAQKKIAKQAIRFYNESADFRGTLLVQPNGLTGQGSMTINNGQIISEKFKFMADEFVADTANFELRMESTKEEESNFADSADFRTINVHATIDMEKRLGKLKSNGEDSYINFPQNQYICYMSEMLWYMDKKMLDLSSSSGEENDSSSVEALGALFISIRPGQDSLQFYAQSSSYDATKKLILAKGVKSIKVANASIVTEDGNVYIEKRAKIRTLDNVVIKTDNYEFLNSTVTIEGKNEFFGSTYYNYIDENDSIQILPMAEITVDSLNITYAKGIINEEQNFKLSPVYKYYGDITIHTNDSVPYFKGNVKIEHECNKLKINKIKPQYIKFAANINPDSIYIPITDVNHENAPYVATFITKDSTHIYTSFLSDIKWWSDYPIIKSDQMLHYDKPTRQYRIATAEKLLSPEEKGNLISLNKDFCTVYNQGDIDIGIDYGQLKINSAGEIFHNIEQDKINIDISFGLNFFFSPVCLELMQNAFQQEANLQSVDISSPSIKYNLKQLSSKNAVDNMFNELAAGGLIETIPTELNKTIFFSDVKFVWDKETQSYVSEGPIGIGFINGKPINKKVFGIIELTKKKSGNLMNLYIEAAPNKWFYFNFSRNVLRTYSSIDEYNNTIATLFQDKDNKLEIERGQTPFSFLPSSERIKNRFLFRMMEEEEEY